MSSCLRQLCADVVDDGRCPAGLPATRSVGTAGRGAARARVLHAHGRAHRAPGHRLRSRDVVRLQPACRRRGPAGARGGDGGALRRRAHGPGPLHRAGQRWLARHRGHAGASGALRAPGCEPALGPVPHLHRRLGAADVDGAVGRWKPLVRRGHRARERGRGASPARGRSSWTTSPSKAREDRAWLLNGTSGFAEGSTALVIRDSGSTCTPGAAGHQPQRPGHVALRYLYRQSLGHHFRQPRCGVLQRLLRRRGCHGESAGRALRHGRAAGGQLQRPGHRHRGAGSRAALPTRDDAPRV